MLAQLGGQGRLAVGAILGAATAALCLLAVSTGDGTMAAPDNPFPLAMNAGPATTGQQVTATTITSTGPTTTTASATARPTSSVVATSTTAAPTDSVVPTSDTPQPTTVPTTEKPPPTTVSRTSRPRPTPTPDPCWFIFC